MKTRLLFNFKTNLTNDECLPEIGSITLKHTKTGNMFTLAGYGYCGRSLQKDVYHGDFENFDLKIDSPNNVTIFEFGDEITEKELAILKDCEPIELFILDTDTPEKIEFCKNLAVRIEYIKNKQIQQIDLFSKEVKIEQEVKD